jgi:hypothetical protein
MAPNSARMSGHVKWMAYPVKHGLPVRVTSLDRPCLEPGLPREPERTGKRTAWTAVLSAGRLRPTTFAFDIGLNQGDEPCP